MKRRCKKGAHANNKYDKQGKVKKDATK